VQNYWLSAFPHTWSLAVEEHFYLALPLVLLLCRSRDETPFRALPWVVAVIAVVCLALRLVGAIHSPVASREFYTATHLRCDSLFFGVLLSWLHHFRRPTWDWISVKAGPFLPLIALAGIAPAFIWQLDKVRALSTWGFTGIYEQLTTSYKNPADEYDWTALTFMANGKYYYISNSSIRLYSGLAAGYCHLNSKSTLSNDNNGVFAFQLNALGIRFGNRVGVLSELGFGYEGVVKAGISFRF
jgi:hypothetical protein